MVTQDCNVPIGSVVDSLLLGWQSVEVDVMWELLLHRDGGVVRTEHLHTSHTIVQHIQPTLYTHTLQQRYENIHIQRAVTLIHAAVTEV